MDTVAAARTFQPMLRERAAEIARARRLRDDGRPDVRMMVFPAAQATLIDTWQVA